MMSTAPARRHWFERIPQARRRVIAVATLLGMPAMFAWSTYWQGTTAPSILWGPVTFLLLGTTIVGALVLYLYVRNRADMPGNGLDERERQLRDRAWILSYQVLSAVVTVAIIGAGLAVFVFGGTLVIDAAVVNMLVLCVAVLLPVLPAAALAWIEPDPADER
jgi:uncharacterized membrane protein